MQLRNATSAPSPSPIPRPSFSKHRSHLSIPSIPSRRPNNARNSASEGPGAVPTHSGKNSSSRIRFGKANRECPNTRRPSAKVTGSTIANTKVGTRANANSNVTVPGKAMAPAASAKSTALSVLTSTAKDPRPPWAFANAETRRFASSSRCGGTNTA